MGHSHFDLNYHAQDIYWWLLLLLIIGLASFFVGRRTSREKKRGSTDKIPGSDYGYKKMLSGVSMDDATERVQQALATEGFGVLTEIDVKDTLKKKLDLEHDAYKILGACNPSLAHRALQIDPQIGLLLPCNVVVRSADAGGCEVMFIKPNEMFKVVANPEFESIVKEADNRIWRAFQAVN